MDPHTPTGPQPTAADARVVALSVGAVREIAEGVRTAQRVLHSIDAVQAARDGADTPTASPATEKVDRAAAILLEIARMAGGAPERADLHTFSLDRLDLEFLRSLMLERGWQKADLLVGSAQGETLARRLIHGADDATKLGAQIRVVPMSEQTRERVGGPDGWMLVERPPESTPPGMG